MSKVIKDKDMKFVEESYWMKYNEQDLEKHSGIKIRNSTTECYLKRKDENDNDYWVKCKRAHNKIVEIEEMTTAIKLFPIKPAIKKSSYLLII